MGFSLKLIVLLITTILAETAAQACLEKGTKGNNKYMFIITGLFLYVVVGTVYYFILKDGSKMAIANALWNAGTSILVAIVGYLLFNQSLNTKEIIGLVLLIIGVYLVG